MALEDKPICPGLKNGVMTFEELIEMKMKQNENDPGPNPPLSPGALAKKQFLKKGEGMSRWVKGTGSPESEQPATPQPSKNPNVRRKIFSASKESSVSKVAAANPAPRVPSHVVPPRSPRQTHHHQSSKAPVKPVPHSNVKRGKQSPVPPSPRSLQADNDMRVGFKASSLPRSISPASATFAPPLVAPKADADPFLNKPTDTTLCSEKEFEQLEEYLGDQPHDISICSQASVVRKFMTRPSMTLKPIPSDSAATKPRPHDVIESRSFALEIASTSLTSSKFQGFQDDEAWESETNLKPAHPEPYIITEPSPSPDLTETPRRQSQKETSELPTQVAVAERPTAPSTTSNAAPDPLQPLNDVLRSKIMQLDVEIDKFRTENRRLEERKRDFEKVQQELIAEKRKFEEHMESENSKFEQFKRQEMSKIKRERAALDQLRTQVHTLASEKNSVELVQLREKLRRVEQESSEKEERQSQALNRSKEQVKRLQTENEDLKRSIEMLERLRIDRNAPAAAPKSAVGLKAFGGSDGSPRTVGNLQSLRKPLPLKSDTRQNCIPQAVLSAVDSTASTSGKTVFTAAKSNNNNNNGSDKISVGVVEKQQQQQLSSGMSDKEDERDAAINSAPSPVNEISAVDAPQLDGSANNEDGTLQSGGAEQAPERNIQSAASRLLESMDPAHIQLMNQWLKDIGLCLLEDDETCVATLEKEFPDGKVEVTRSDGSRRIQFANGTVKVTGAEGTPVFIRFFNKDMKKVTEDGTIYYYYADTQTIQSTFPDGLEVMEFSNGQVEKKYPNGTQDVVFPDGTVKQTYPDGVEVCTFADGCIVTTSVNGDRVIEFPNGQKEMHTAEYKSRVYPNGIVRVVYKTGLCETRYPNGEVRRKFIRETTTNDAPGASASSQPNQQLEVSPAACNP